VLLVAGKLHAQEVAQTPPPAETGRAVEFSLTDRAGQFRYYMPFELAGVHSEVNYGFFLNENRDFVGNAELLFNSNLELGPISLRVGPQLYAALLGNPNRDNVVAIAFGGEVRYDLIRRYSVALVGSAFYSPTILTFGRANNVNDFIARGEIRILPRMILFAGYRWFKFTLSGEPNERLNNALLVGVRWQLH
jgi:hypothetical protein